MYISSLILPIVLFAASAKAGSQACHYGSPCWPSQNEWKKLNSTLHGRLVRARPSAAPCHGAEYDQQQCEIAQANWFNTTWRSNSPGALLDIAWENGYTDCWIDGPREAECPQALVPVYVAQAQTAKDIQAAVKFASRHSLSTTVKGAGHDYLGRSFGNGTFNIATIKLKGIEFEDSFKPKGAPGKSERLKVVHVGAGEHWYDVYAAADKAGRIVVGGASSSVGAAGGWVLGGGHSSLSPQYGLGVDNVVEFEIVTPDGELRVANSYKNKDLFWALRGGGAGFGVIVRVTYLTHPPISLSTIFLIQINHTQEVAPDLLKTWLLLQPALSSANFSGYSYPSAERFQALLYLYNSFDPASSNSTLQPLWDFVETERENGTDISAGSLSIPLPSYFAQFDDFGETQGAGAVSLLGSRLFPREFFEDEEKVGGLATFLSDKGVIFHLIAGGQVSKVQEDATAIHPSWRHAIQHIVLVSGWDKDTPVALRPFIAQSLTNQTQTLGEFVPGFGAYINEADRNELNWQETFWGSNYKKLLKIKRSIDPKNLFTCAQCVGYEGI